MSALITSSNSLKALTVIRSLGKKGIYIIAGDKKKNSLGAYSRYSDELFNYPDPEKKQTEFIMYLLSMLRKKKVDVLMPVHSEDTYIISRYKCKLEKYTNVPYMEYDTIDLVNNKSRFLKDAKSIELPIPETYHPEDYNSLNKISGIINYPAVIKLRKTSSSIGLSYVYSAEELIQTFKETIIKYNLNKNEFPIIQEYINGEGYGVSLLFNEGDLRAFFTHKRRREYPIYGGPSTSRISVRHKEMEKIAIELLKHYNWHGVAMVEFKLTNEGKPVIMEVNPRFWGSVNQAVLSGVDFPYLLYLMATEGDVKPVLNYQTGIITRNAIIDFVALYKLMIKEKNPLLIKEFFSYPLNDDLISLRDPLPTFGYINKCISELKNSRYNQT